MKAIRLGLAAVLIAAAPAVAQMTSGVEVAESAVVRAKVLTVDRQAGQILLRDLDSGEVFVHEPPGGLSGVLGVESGDLVEARATRGVTARLAGAGDANRTEVDLMTARTDTEGDAGIMAGILTTSVVTLTDWNPETGVAAGTTPEGDAVEYQVATEEGRAFLDARSMGDRIEVEISETLVLVKLAR